METITGSPLLSRIVSLTLNNTGYEGKKSDC